VFWLPLTATAWAGGYTLVGSGVRAQGRAGAFVAGADDVSAQWYNPAALTNVHQGTLSLEGWLTQQVAWFDREDIPGVNPFPEVETTADPVFEPSGGYVSPLGGLHPALANTTVALGLMVPTGSDYAWPADGAQRYALVSSAIRQAYVGPSVAHAFTPWLAVGASLQYTFLKLDETLTATLCEEGGESCGSDSPIDDVRLDVSATDPGKLTWNAGVLLQPHPRVKIGASVQPGVDFEARGATTSTLNPDNGLFDGVLTGDTFTDDDVTVVVSLPWTVRAGVEVSPVDPVRVELATAWTNWSRTSALRVTDLDLALTTTETGPMQGESIVVSDDVSLATGFVDTWSLHLGAEVEAHPALRVRAGVFGETSATPDSYANPGVADADKLGGSVGLSARIGPHLSIHGSGLYTLFADREVSASRFAQPALYIDYNNQFATRVGAGREVGNGTYGSTAWVAGLGASWAFGAARE
jgi:long-chain fatty acid transport protein